MNLSFDELEGSTQGTAREVEKILPISMFFVGSLKSFTSIL